MPAVPAPSRGGPGHNGFGEVDRSGDEGSHLHSGGGSGRITPLGWIGRGLVLCAISVVSGLLWLVFQPSAPPDTTGAEDGQGPQRPRTAYEFTEYLSDEPTNCADHSTGKIARFFGETPCEHLTRALYTTQLNNGEKVLTSVVTVLMPDAESAESLERMATRNATGNIEDLVTAGKEVPERYPTLSHDYGYDSTHQGRLVVIGESSYFGRSDSDDGRLKNVTTEALKLGRGQDEQPG
ncbi:hypothetical protein SAMN04487905_104196 [Actinopolyspora xinjiangensis]|uniref:Uncharacterized protein n=1 Tax=Actinopolyspora xinjiangensis TaxID=405564 RepID=A0A1H0SW19_9ACTN|nr:hypothetical protein SAMN04487905_104196 [Actinopolyspora xinjiangensis]